LSPYLFQNTGSGLQGSESILACIKVIKLRALLLLYSELYLCHSWSVAGVGIVAKFCDYFYLQTRPVPYSQVVFIQAHKEGKPPVPVVFALLSKKVSLFYSYNT
jgi:hypothetical protein